MTFKIEPSIFPIVPTLIGGPEIVVEDEDENPFTKMQEEIDALSAKVAALESAN